MTVLSGRNGAGKTNILRAIEWAARSAVRPIADEKLFGPASHVELYFSLSGNDYRYQIRTERERPDSLKQPKSLFERLFLLRGQDWSPLITRDGRKIELHEDRTTVVVEVDVSALPAAMSLLPDSSVIIHCERALHFLSAIKYYPLDEPERPKFSAAIRFSDLAKVLSEEDQGPRSSILARLIQLAIERPDDYEELKSLIGPQGLSIIKDVTLIYVSLSADDKDPLPKSGRVTPDIKNLLNPNDIYIVCNFHVASEEEDSGSYQYQDLSFGTRRLIRLFTHMIYDRNSVMLLEQPEDGIHPGLLHKVIPQLRAYADSRQFMLASHSAEIFNRVTPQEIRLVELTGAGTIVRALSGPELEAASDYLKSEGSLADFIRLME